MAVAFVGPQRLVALPAVAGRRALLSRSSGFEQAHPSRWGAFLHRAFAPVAGVGTAALIHAAGRRRRSAAGNLLLAHVRRRGEALTRCASTAAGSAALEASDAVLFRKSSGIKISCSPQKDGAAPKRDGGALVLFVRAGKEEESVELCSVGQALDKELDGALLGAIAEERFEGKEGKAMKYIVGRKDLGRIVLVGVSPDKEGKSPDWRQAGAAAAGLLKELRGGVAGVVCPGDLEAQPLVEGLLLGMHTDKRFRGSKTPEKEKEHQGPEQLELLVSEEAVGDAEDGAKRGEAVASGTIWGRELVNASPNVLTPPALADAAKKMAAEVGLESKILDKKDCEKMGMGMFLAVSAASNIPPKLIHLIYKPPGGKAKRKIGIVGKGLTFDAGGYNIKTGSGSPVGIEFMKFDMGGSAAALGSAAAVAQLQPEDVEVHFVVATCENMISGNVGAMRPSDIITAMDGTTVEVNNTDAEGRLTLGDALLYCQDQGVEQVVDIATLTGACLISLGQHISGMWSNDDALAGSIDAASKAVGEQVWRMPLEQSYFDGLKSEVADMKNTGPRWGGAITAALFLEKFVRDDVAWAHLDIAGTAWAEKTRGVNNVGGTGSMVRTLTELVVKG